MFCTKPFIATSPVDPVAPVGPAGPGTGTVTTAAGVTTVGLSHALNASAISTAENTIEYFMRIPFDCLTKTAHLDRFAATRCYSSKVSMPRFKNDLGPALLARIKVFVAFSRPVERQFVRDDDGRFRFSLCDHDCSNESSVVPTPSLACPTGAFDAIQNRHTLFRPNAPAEGRAAFWRVSLQAVRLIAS